VPTVVSGLCLCVAHRNRIVSPNRSWTGPRTFIYRLTEVLLFLSRQKNRPPSRMAYCESRLFYRPSSFSNSAIAKSSASEIFFAFGILLTGFTVPPRPDVPVGSRSLRLAEILFASLELAVVVCCLPAVRPILADTISWRVSRYSCGLILPGTILPELPRSMIALSIWGERSLCLDLKFCSSTTMRAC